MESPTEEHRTERGADRKAELVRLMRAAVSDLRSGVAEAVAELRCLEDEDMAEAIKLALLYRVAENRPENGVHVAISLLVDSILKVEPSKLHAARAHAARAQKVSKMAKIALGATDGGRTVSDRLRRLAEKVWWLENNDFWQTIELQYKVESLVEDLERLRDDGARSRRPEIDRETVAGILAKNTTLETKVTNLSIEAALVPGHRDNPEGVRSLVKKALKVSPF